MSETQASESIWFNQPDLALLQTFCKNNAAEHCGVEFIEIGSDYLVAKMPVDHRTKQPIGLLHGGMSVMLAETVASCAAALTVDMKKYTCVGQEINANHLRSARSGWVYATAQPHYIGGKSQVWQIEIKDQNGVLLCISRMTAAIVKTPIPSNR